MNTRGDLITRLHKSSGTPPYLCSSSLYFLLYPERLDTISDMSAILTLQSTVKLSTGMFANPLRRDIRELTILMLGYTIPRLGFGVYRNEGDTCKPSVLEAFKAGYRSVLFAL